MSSFNIDQLIKREDIQQVFTNQVVVIDKLRQEQKDIQESVAISKSKYQNTQGAFLQAISNLGKIRKDMESMQKSINQIKSLNKQIKEKEQNVQIQQQEHQSEQSNQQEASLNEQIQNEEITTKDNHIEVEQNIPEAQKLNEDNIPQQSMDSKIGSNNNIISFEPNQQNPYDDQFSSLQQNNKEEDIEEGDEEIIDFTS